MYETIKGIFGDFNSTFLWYKSDDINEKKLFPKFQLILTFRLQIMHDYVHWPCSIDYYS